MLILLVISVIGNNVTKYTTTTHLKKLRSNAAIVQNELSAIQSL